jgi:hypothetical protein
VVQYELFKQRQFVPSKYWHLYPVVEEPSEKDEEMALEECGLEEIQEETEYEEIENQKKEKELTEIREYPFVSSFVGTLTFLLNFLGIGTAASEMSVFIRQMISTADKDREELLSTMPISPKIVFKC